MSNWGGSSSPGSLQAKLWLIWNKPAQVSFTEYITRVNWLGEPDFWNRKPRVVLKSQQMNSEFSLNPLSETGPSCRQRGRTSVKSILFFFFANMIQASLDLRFNHTSYKLKCSYEKWYGVWGWTRGEQRTDWAISPPLIAQPCLCVVSCDGHLLDNQSLRHLMLPPCPCPQPLLCPPVLFWICPTEGPKSCANTRDKYWPLMC